MASFGSLGEDHEDLILAFGQAIDACTELYEASAEVWSRTHSDDSPLAAGEIRSRMRDLARGLVLKIFLTIVQADQRFSLSERKLAQLMLSKCWGRLFPLDEVGAVLQDLVTMAEKFDWYSLVRPFDEVPPLRERCGDLETIVLRLGNLIAKSDGAINVEETLQLKGVIAEINRHLRPVPLEAEPASGPPLPRCDDIRQAMNAAHGMLRASDGSPAPSDKPAPPPPNADERKQAALNSLDELIGLKSIKHEVRELTRFLRVQQQREQAGLPKTQVGLHCVFSGNPGTGKTSVARILGQILGALGVVKQGHLVEADRSALVAGFMGQTAERTNKIVDRALGGVLFIDEAYSLIAEEGDDPYGHEAVQTLLKRMEDDRDRLVVILAGYSEPMQRLIESNPGLASRFQHTYRFPDYSVTELCQIFQVMCEKNHYRLPAATRARLIVGFAHLLNHRDEQFGNGRLVRNVFEQSIRRLASRVADIAPLTKELLTHLDPADIQLPGISETTLVALAESQTRFVVTCPGCQQTSNLKPSYLGCRVQCKKCGQQFSGEWAELGTV